MGWRVGPASRCSRVQEGRCGASSRGARLRARAEGGGDAGVGVVHVDAHVPEIALLQLHRGPEQCAVEKPAISDLRESGSLEQDADMFILLHRESAYEKDNPRQGEADFIVAKHRNGPTTPSPWR